MRWGNAAGYAQNAAGYAQNAAGYAQDAAGYAQFCRIIIPLRGPSCKLRLSRFSAKLKFQDGPSVAKLGQCRSNCHFQLLKLFLKRRKTSY